MPDRLSGTRSFRRLYAEGRRARSDGIAVVAARAESPGATTRLGLAVRTRPWGAVARNRVKRRLRSAAAECGLPPGWDLVVQADASTLRLRFQDLVGELTVALERAGVAMGSEA